MRTLQRWLFLLVVLSAGWSVPAWSVLQVSPTWSPDGRWLAYVSFEGRNSRIIVQEIATGLRREITAFPGINAAPAFSPDGRRLAFTLSRDGSPDIYVLTLESGELRRLTSGPEIDTEAAWSPDGRTLIRLSAAGGGAPERLTSDGRYRWELMAREQQRPEQERKAIFAKALEEYIGAIQSSVARNWRRPTGVPPGLKCTVNVVQATNGTVLRVEVSQSSGNVTFDRSVERAVRAASPLPPPRHKAVFDREIVFLFNPGS